MTDRPLVLSQGTFLGLATGDFLEVCRQTGMAAGLWHGEIGDLGVEQTRATADELGVELASLCRVGFWTDPDPDGHQHAANVAILDDAVTLGTRTVVVVVGAVRRAGFDDALARILAGLRRLVPEAESRGLDLAIEPFHPMLAAERSAVVTLAEATRLVREVGSPHLGIALDAYHVWWDPSLETSLRDAAPHVMSVHLCDWIVPTTSLLRGRGVPGDGVIDLDGLLRQLDDLGYAGRFEVEVLSDDLGPGSPASIATHLEARTREVLARRPTDRRPVGASS